MPANATQLDVANPDGAGPACDAGLPTDNVAHLKRWLQEHQAHVVKHGPHRTVYRVDTPRRSFIVKQYRCHSWRDVARSLLRSSNAHREWRKSLEVARRGLPTARQVAVAEERRGPLVGDSFVVSEAIPDACSLFDFISTDLGRLPHVRRTLIDRLADLCAAAHDAGVHQTDMHADNILVQCVAFRSAKVASFRGAKGDGLFLIDLPTVRFSGPLGWSKSRDNLAMFCVGLLADSTRSERWRFWRRYLAGRKDFAVSQPRRAAAEVYQRALAWYRHLVRRRGRRCLRNNRDFYRRQSSAAQGHAVVDLPREHFDQLLADPEAPLRQFRHRVEKLSLSSMVVAAEMELAGKVVRVAYKRSRIKSWWKALWPFRRGRALGGWQLGHALMLRGIATARPVFVCQPRRGRDSYLATEWIDGAENLHLYGWRLAKLPPAERARLANRGLQSLARLIARMHAWHVSHRDLKGGNLVVVQKSDGTSAYLLDLDGVDIRRRLRPSTRVQNLARLAVSLQLHPWVTRTMVLRFLKAYLKALSHEAKDRDWKALWRAVTRRAERITRRIRGAGRKVA